MGLWNRSTQTNLRFYLAYISTTSKSSAVFFAFLELSLYICCSVGQNSGARPYCPPCCCMCVLKALVTDMRCDRLWTFFNTDCLTSHDDFELVLCHGNISYTKNKSLWPSSQSKPMMAYKLLVILSFELHNTAFLS